MDAQPLIIHTLLFLSFQNDKYDGSLHVIFSKMADISSFESALVNSHLNQIFIHL